MSEQQLAANTLEFMKRADLKGGEAPEFMNCVNWLLEKVNNPANGVAQEPRTEAQDVV